MSRQMPSEYITGNELPGPGEEFVVYMRPLIETLDRMQREIDELRGEIDKLRGEDDELICTKTLDE